MWKQSRERSSGLPYTSVYSYQKGSPSGHPRLRSPILLIPKFCMMVRVFANGPGDLGSIPGRVIPKTQKWYLMPPYLTLSIIVYGSRVKWNDPGKGVAPSSTPRSSSYRKWSLRVPSTMVTNFTYHNLFSCCL